MKAHDKPAAVPDEFSQRARSPVCCWADCANPPERHAIFTRDSRSLDHILRPVDGELSGKTHADVCDAHLPLLMRLASDTLIVRLGSCEAGC